MDFQKLGCKVKNPLETTVRAARTTPAFSPFIVVDPTPHSSNLGTNGSPNSATQWAVSATMKSSDFDSMSVHRVEHRARPFSKWYRALLRRVVLLFKATTLRNIMQTGYRYKTWVKRPLYKCPQCTCTADRVVLLFQAQPTM
jgi:hypothetical protein